MGRIFENCKEAMDEIERDIVEMGIKVHPHSMQNKNVKDDDNFSTLELQNYSFTILDGRDYNGIVPHHLWLASEFMERMDQDINPGEAYKLRKEIWEPFLVLNKFDYTYSERIHAENQFDRVIEELKKNPDTRQAIIHIHEPKDVKSIGGKKRVPCSMYYQLMIRRGKLDIIYNMRSSDFGTHFQNDIALAMMLQRFIGKCIDVEAGLFSMNVGSLHIYKGYGEHKHVF